MERERERNQTVAYNAPSNACLACWGTKKGIYVPISVYLDGKMFGYRYQCPLCSDVLPNSLSRPNNGKINDFNVEKWPEIRKNKWNADILRERFNQERWVQSEDLRPRNSIEEDLANAIL